MEGGSLWARPAVPLREIEELGSHADPGIALAPP
jgi:hypothetical protein